ncbi:Alpha/Beta hydrolase protein [Penicillium cataractarum]|uniref:Alpha/Beta hydrolase protein n=1 Tax=Penicillium cataractarum TaxID=2100454 RepID=A0A9W9S205_9EURO|nr:Alpha/Beta hydrolase protein [Penicillium cataractarum]KAJ5370561.1 Alpha/Beta hydrolase protein [Penicillium cataractarum]
MESTDVEIRWRPLPPPEESKAYPGFHPSVTLLPVGHKRRENSRALHEPMVFERDQTLCLRDGTKIYADIYRPVNETAVPAIMVWGPYGKSGSGNLNLSSFPLRVGIAENRLSGYESFEGPDPAEWVPRGYAIVNVDARGAMDSEGSMRFWGSGDGKDGYDAIEEIAALPWCNGKVAMLGNSWLAISQWFIAAERPPHLACIAPLEGVSDPLREQFRRGGIPELQFWNALSGLLCGRNEVEDIVTMAEESVLTNSYWEDKRAKLDQIEVPAYILASYSTMLHTLGSFRGYEEIPHDKKWLVIHGTQEWYDLYSPERIQELAAFFDCYTKAHNNWESTPRVRATVLPFNQPALTDIPFEEPFWPHCQTEVKRLFLNSEGRLTEAQPQEPGQSVYQADFAPIWQRDNDSGEIQFSFTFPRRTTILGPSRAVIYVETKNGPDMDIYVHLRKADRNGKPLQHVNIPLHDLGVASAEEAPLTNPMKYFGPHGILRASYRDVAEELSKPHWKTLSHRKQLPIKVGEPMRLEIEIWPTGMLFEPGEQLVMKVSGHFMAPAEFEALQGTFPYLADI